MGQYYRVFIKEGKKKPEVFNRYVIVNGKPEYTMAKLTEHSWWLNPFVSAIAEKIYNAAEPVQLIWMGDYADEFLSYYESENKYNGIALDRLLKYYEATWGKDIEGKAIETSDFSLDGKFLINHTKKEFINCTTYFEASVMRSKKYGDWCMHPLPLLTCIGNGCGGGDYKCATLASTEHLVGTWAWDKISITNEAPTDCEEIFPIFKETGWEDEET